MYTKTPRLLKAQYRKSGYMLISNCNNCTEVTNGWDTLVRSGHPVLKTITLDSQRIVNKVRLWSTQIKGIQVYLLGDWLTNSNSVRRAGQNERKLSSSSWSWWLTRAYLNGKWLSKYAVLWTIGRFIHVDRRRTRGMIPGHTLYDKFVQFLDLYNTFPPLRSIQAFLQLSDKHYWSTKAVCAAEEVIEQYYVEEQLRDLVSEMIDDAKLSTAARHELGMNGHIILYQFILSCQDKELARIIFNGITVMRPTVRPRHVHGHWHCAHTQKTNKPKNKLFDLLLWLEFNSFLPSTERYTNKYCDIDVPFFVKTNSFWVTRKLRG